MADAPVIVSAATIVPVNKMSDTLDFYLNVLGFRKTFVAEDNSYACIVRDNAMIAFVSTSDPEVLKATATNISIYLYVKDLEALYESLRAGLEALPEGRLRPPFVQDYGMREFHVKDPDGCLLFFGEAVM